MKPDRHIQLLGVTDVGCVRSGNEDCFIIQEMGAVRETLNPKHLFDFHGAQDLFAAVSDGMGGAAAGEVASRTALLSLVDYLDGNVADLAKATPQELVSILEGGVQTANREILKKARELRAHQGMGATITATYIKDGILYLFQIGDSRAYVLRDNKLHRISRDQSFVGHLVEMGTITEEQAMRHPQRNVILQALGTQDTLKVDVSYLPLCKDDLVLICSDGLYGEFLPEQLEQRVLDLLKNELAEGLGNLLEAAKAAGGKDNITIIGLKVHDGAPEPEPAEEPRYIAFSNLDRDNPLDKAQSLFQ